MQKKKLKLNGLTVYFSPRILPHRDGLHRERPSSVVWLCVRYGEVSENLAKSHADPGSRMRKVA